MSKAGTAKVKAKKSEINDGEEVLQVLSCCSHRKASFVGFTLPPQAPDPARGGRPCPAHASRIARHLVPHCLAMSSIVGSWWASFAFPHAQRLVRRAVRFPRFALSGNLSEVPERCKRVPVFSWLVLRRIQTLQAVLLADSFKKRMAPINYTTPKILLPVRTHPSPTGGQVLQSVRPTRRRFATCQSSSIRWNFWSPLA